MSKMSESSGYLMHDDFAAYATLIIEILFLKM